MSLHYPHHVGTTRRRRTERRQMSGVVYRYPRVVDPTAMAFAQIASQSGVGRAARESVGPNADAWERESDDFRASRREAAAIFGGVLVVLITAWLIWGALAEASLARAGLL